MRLTAEDKAAMADYWAFFEPIADAVNAELRESLLALPEWARSFVRFRRTRWPRRTRPASSASARRSSRTTGAPYLEDTRAQGTPVRSRRRVVRRLVRHHRDLSRGIRLRLIELAKKDPPRAARVAEGMNRWIDIAMSHLGEAYLAAKEQIITHQQEAIRELSVPVLQVRERLLILPLVGMIDSSRARQLIENLLAAIRDHRAGASSST